jgi:antitoxin VapB
MSEKEVKASRIGQLLEERALDALVLRRASSFAWATCGRAGYVNTATDFADASLVYTPQGRYLVANNIETPRLLEEEGLGVQGWEPVTSRWHEPDDALGKLTEGLRVGADFALPGATDVSSDVAALRARLTPEEGGRFRELGRLCADAMDAAMRAIRPGQTEHQIAATLAGEAIGRGVWPAVDLVATDERIYKYRHPLPTEKKLERYAMVVLCGRKWGLICSLTRLVHFGPLPEELRRKQDATARVDAAFISTTRPGARLADIFARATKAYAAGGYPDEWRLHHQGGAAGYEPRESLGTPSSEESVEAGQAYAWNPSITGVKSEDTILVGPDHTEVLTRIEGWPTVEVEAGDQTLQRPAILEAS